MLVTMQYSLQNQKVTTLLHSALILNINNLYPCELYTEYSAQLSFHAWAFSSRFCFWLHHFLTCSWTAFSSLKSGPVLAQVLAHVLLIPWDLDRYWNSRRDQTYNTQSNECSINQFTYSSVTSVYFINMTELHVIIAKAIAGIYYCIYFDTTNRVVLICMKRFTV